MKTLPAEGGYLTTTERKEGIGLTSASKTYLLPIGITRTAGLGAYRQRAAQAASEQRRAGCLLFKQYNCSVISRRCDGSANPAGLLG